MRLLIKIHCLNLVNITIQSKREYVNNEEFIEQLKLSICAIFID